jgi:predicted enzyme related to lactoylglutathione lyase
MTSQPAQPAASFGLSQIGQIAIVVHDTDRAVAFYRDTLGIQFLFRAGNLAFFNAAGVRLMLTPAEKPEFDHPASILYFSVPDIRAAHAALVARGVKFDDEPHLIARLPDREVWMCFFRDCENNLMALMSEPRI